MAAHPYAIRVARMLTKEGFPGVTLEHRVAKELWRPNGRSYITFDVSYLVLTGRHAARLLLGEAPRNYIECKYRSREVVSERDVAKFLEDLHVCAIPYEHGLVVTNTGYQPLAIDYARKRGVALYTFNGKDARGLHRRLRTILGGSLPFTRIA